MGLEASYKGSEAMFRIRKKRWHLVKLSHHRRMQVSSSETANGAGAGRGWGWGMKFGVRN